MTPILIAAGLVAYNNLLNLWPRFQGPAYVALNVGLAAGLLALAFGPLGHDAAALGLRGGRARGALLGAAIAAVTVAPLFLALVSPRLAARVADRRVAGLDHGSLAFRTLVRIPLGTALLEEVAFRGVLFAAFRSSGMAAVPAALASSIAFGLWHVVPTLDALSANRPGSGAAAAVLAVTGGAAATTAGGLLLVWLRLRTGTLATPLALHAALNSLATVAAFLAHGRAR